MNIPSASIVPLVMAAMILAPGCGVNDAFPPSPSQPQQLSGTLRGGVTLYDVRAIKLADHGGVRVTVDGTAYQATTQTDGTWSIPNLPAGTYSLTFSKDGYNDHKIFGYGFVGGGDGFTSEVSMIAPARDIEFTRFDMSVVAEHLFFSGSISKPEFQDLPVAVYFGLTPNVSSSSRDHIHSVWVDGFYNNLPPGGLTQITPDYLRLFQGVSSGSTIYCRAYVISPLGSSYYDPVIRSLIKTDISHGSRVVSFTIP